MMKITDNRITLYLLYYLFFAYIAASMLSTDGNTMFYIATFPFLGVGIILIVCRVGCQQVVNINFLILFFLILIVFFSSPVEKYNIYARLFYIELLILIFLFYDFKISVSAFSTFVNSTYFIYLLFSLTNWLGLFSLTLDEVKNSFFIHFGDVSFETLYGIGGSTADIDSYSGLVLMWNILINKESRFRYLIIVISAFSMLMTFRFTPVVALITSFLTYFFVVNRFLAIVTIVLPVFGFIGVLLILHFDPTAKVPFVSTDMDWYTFLWDATHARSSIWNGQIYYYVTEFSFGDFIYGPLDERMTATFIDGEGRLHKESFNPHNTYLAMLFRSSVLFVIFYTLFLFSVMRRSRRSIFPIVFYISIVAYTNSSILGLQNPIYLLVLLYFFMALPMGDFKSSVDVEMLVKRPV